MAAGERWADDSKDSYERRGVSATKGDVKSVVWRLDKGLFPGAFGNIVEDIFTGSSDHCVILHADGAGTKSALAYLHWRRHGDATVFHGISQDALVMNLDDMVCVGAVGPFALSNTIGRNAKLVPREVLEAIVNGYDRLLERLRAEGIIIHSCGGETADIGDLVRTVVVDATMATRMSKAEVIDCSRVKPGHEIVGLASFGKAAYEDTENSGIGANGFTAARHELLNSALKEEFPETFAPEIAPLAYCGGFDIDDRLPGTNWSVGQALLSPTRTYAPLLRRIIPSFRSSISAIFHNTGGGQTKCLGFGGDVRYEKLDLFPIPAIFRFLREHSRLSLREMFTVFNMGHRLEIVCDPSVSGEIIQMAAAYSIGAKIIGHVTRSAEGRQLVIETDGQTLEFQAAR